MSTIHPFVQLVAVIWICATIAAAFTKKGEPMGAAAGVTILAGIGYLMLKGK